MTICPQTNHRSALQKSLVETTLHTVSIGIIANLADLYIYQNRYSDAEPLLQGVLAMRTWLLGSDHIDVALSLYQLATLYDNQGRYHKAQPMFQKALAIFEQRLGEDHPSTKTLRQQLRLLIEVNRALDL